MTAGMSSDGELVMKSDRAGMGKAVMAMKVIAR